MKETLATIAGLTGAAFMAVLWRLVTQRAIEKVIAHLLFKGLHWLAKRTTNTLDDELVKIVEDSYHVKGTDDRAS